MRATQTKHQAQPKVPPDANEGEGNHTAARRYDAGVEKTAKSGDVKRLAREAARALDGPEGKALKDAENTARGGPSAIRAPSASRDSLDRAEDEGMTAPAPKKETKVQK